MDELGDERVLEKICIGEDTCLATPEFF